MPKRPDVLLELALIAVRRVPADVLGHTSVRMAGRYSHLMQDHKRMNLERMVRERGL